MGPEVFQPHVSFPVSLLVIRRLAFYSGHASVAVFDVVKSARKQSPFVLLQPRLRLQDIFPSTIHQGDYPDDETAFVGLVPGTDSLFALSPDHFPLVAFSESAPAERIEGSEAVIVSGEHGTLQCFEGTTDRQCLTGVRALRADSRSRLARLLDGVPGPATTPLPSATSDPARSEHANSQAYVEDEPLIVPGEGKPSVLPWEWVNGVEEALSQGQKPWAPSSSLLLALVSVFASFLWFSRKKPSNRRGSAVYMNAGPTPDKLVRGMPTDGNAVSIPPLELTNGATHTTPAESQAVITRPNVKTTPPEISVLAPTEFSSMTHEPSTTTPATSPDVPMPLSATGGNVKVSPVKPESNEGVEDVGEVKKKHRKRRRRRKGDAKDAAAEGGEDPENEDGEGGEDGNAVSPGTLSLGPPSTPVPPTSSSLVVSDTVLGMSSITYVQ